eukprot:gene47722-58462_t
MHPNARTTPRSRADIVRMVRAEGQTVKAAAAAFTVCPKTVRKWLARYQTAGPAGLQARSSRPHRSPRRIAAERCAQALACRREGLVYTEIAQPTTAGMPSSRAMMAAWQVRPPRLVTMALAQQMNQTSAPLPRGESEYGHAGLEMAPSRFVKPPRVAGSPAALECKLLSVQQLVDLDGVGVGVVAQLGAGDLHVEPAIGTDALDLEVGHAVVGQVARRCELAGCVEQRRVLHQPPGAAGQYGHQQQRQVVGQQTLGSPQPGPRLLTARHRRGEHGIQDLPPSSVAWWAFSRRS